MDEAVRLKELSAKKDAPDEKDTDAMDVYAGEMELYGRYRLVSFFRHCF